MFINRYRPMGGWGGSVILVRHNLSIIPPVEHNFEHNTLVSRVMPESIILYFSSIIRQTLYSIELQLLGYEALNHSTTQPLNYIRNLWGRDCYIR